MADIEDFYELLGVSSRSTAEELKRAYRRKARELHPDTNPDPGAEEQFKKVTLAYETLRDPERRRRYDMYGPEGLRGSGGGAGGAGGFGDVFTTGLGDLFESIFGSGPFGGGREPSGPPRGSDIEVALELDFAEAVFGGEHEVSVRAPVACPTCNATGARPPSKPKTCTTCGGAGQVRQVRQSVLGQMVTAGPCPGCRGAGVEIDIPCEDCRGEGRRTEARTYKVVVPAGVDHGNTLRLSGKGAAGPRGGAAGELYVHIRVRPHERFERQGQDMVESLHIPLTQAALGAHLRYETLDGEEDLVVPKGTQTGRVFRLRGRGVPHVSGRGRGDLLVRAVVDTPTGLSNEQEELLRLLAAARDEEVAPADSGFLAKIRSAFR